MYASCALIGTHFSTRLGECNNMRAYFGRKPPEVFRTRSVALIYKKGIRGVLRTQTLGVRRRIEQASDTPRTSGGRVE